MKITNSHMDSNTISGSKITTNSMSGDKITTNSMSGLKIADGTIDADKMCASCMVIMNIPYYISGLSLTWRSVHELTISPGYARNYDGSTKSIESSEDIIVDIEASGINGLDTGHEEDDEWYYIWILKNNLTESVCGLISKSTTTPTLPSGYAYKRLIGSVRNSRGNFLNFIQFGDGRSRKYTYVENMESTLRVLSEGHDTDWSIVDMEILLPETSKIATLYSEIFHGGIMAMRPWDTDFRAYTRCIGESSFTHESAINKRRIEYRVVEGEPYMNLSVLGYTEGL